MSTPALEVFANVPSCVASGASGTTTTDTAWTMGTGSTSFPAASNTSIPATYFYVCDPADTTHEIVKVVNVSGTAWTVQRGALGTTAVAHASGATWVQTVTHGTLQNFKQTPGTTSSAVTVNATTTETVLAAYQPLSTDLVAGTAFDVICFGPITTPHVGATLQFNLYWGGSGTAGGAYTATGGTLLARLLTGSNAPALPSTVAAGASFDLNGDIVYLSSTQAHANMNAWYTNATSLATTLANASVVNSASTTPYGSQTGPITISGTGPIFLTAKWSTTTPGLVAVAPIIRRAV